jgi:hypothetical protein
MERGEIIAKYSDLENLYIPEKGEIIRWGTGCALVVQSPLESEAMPPLMVITLNRDIEGVGPFDGTQPFRVRNGSGMGPDEKLSFSDQKRLVDYYDRFFNDRFAKLFAKFPDVKAKWDAHCAQEEFAELINNK